MPRTDRHWTVYAAVLLCGAVAFAQEPEEAETDEDESVEEIIVVAPRPGDRRRVEPDVLDDPLRARIMKDLAEAEADREEFEWRRQQAIENPSRIKLGYDPRDEYEMRREMDPLELPMDRNKPATLFRIQF